MNVANFNRPKKYKDGKEINTIREFFVDMGCLKIPYLGVCFIPSIWEWHKINETKYN